MSAQPRVLLPTDFPRSPVPLFLRGSEHTTLDDAVTERLRALSLETGVPAPVVLLTAFTALLHRYTGLEEVTVGSVGFADGLVPRPLVVPLYAGGDASFVDLLEHVARTVAEALTDCDAALAQPDPSNLPFTVMFVPCGESFTAQTVPVSRADLAAVGEYAAASELVLVAETREQAIQLECDYDAALFAPSTVVRLLAQYQKLLGGVVSDVTLPLSRLPLLTDEDRQLILRDWNQTERRYEPDRCLPALFEAQVAKTPDAVALIFQDQAVTYAELNARANQLAHYLRGLGVGSDSLVGLCADRSVGMVVGLLGILKAGGAYLPLDPGYPPDRLAFMLADSGATVLVSQRELGTALPAHQKPTVWLDARELAGQSRANPHGLVHGANLAYVLYTSGSTGRPKGVMVTHRNVANFLVAMDEHLPADPPGVWLAVTSISFDISVLELLWTLCRGFRVVLQGEHDGLLNARGHPAGTAGNAMQFSLFYFSSDERQSAQDKYRLLIDGATFADRHGFTAVWTPERHFHEFGGAYPNPSVTSAALAMVTDHVALRGGSVVLPLHSPLRVAEEWAVVDNLSQGRVGLAFASGWHADDFAFAPHHFADRKAVTRRAVETVRQLWRGEAVPVTGGAGNELLVRTLPRPVQPELPVWITTSGDPETFRMAGELGANLLTHLLGQSLDDLAVKLTLYRDALRVHHPERFPGHVSLMLHTFVGRDLDTVRAIVRQPFITYLKASFGLIRNLARSLGRDVDPAKLAPDDLDSLMALAFDRYFETSGLLGTPETCLQMVERLQALGVDEVACLIDFGVDYDSVMASLELLDQVRQRAQSHAAGAPRYTESAQIARHRVTHLQCTPSLARILAQDPASLSALRSLRTLLLGGEALPPDLAALLMEDAPVQLLNMYGPTETTVWSTVYPVQAVDGSIPIGRPVANTQLYVLDSHRQPVPVGVAGELYIGGDGVTRGYLNRPELTAERFVPNPFRPEQPEARLYQTGDVVRYRLDGVLDFLGRLDHQVKIRGHRIEMGEIETLLQEHPSVRRAVVEARDDTHREQQLVAYVVPDPAHPTAIAALREFLAQRLPSVMVPAAFVVLDDLPLTPNGKIARGALPAAAEASRDLPRSYQAPRNELEQDLTRIWEKVLGVRPIGIQDNFFDLGGHSLLAVSLFAEIEARYGRNFPLATLLSGPTIAQLAGMLQLGNEAVHWSSLVPIRRAGSKPAFFCVHSEGGNVMEYYPLAHYLDVDRPFYALQAQNLDGKQVVRPRIEEMARHYLAEVRTVQPHGPYFLGGFCLGGVIAFEMARQLSGEGEHVAIVAMIENPTGEYLKSAAKIPWLRALGWRLLMKARVELSDVFALDVSAVPTHIARRIQALLVKGEVRLERTLLRVHLARSYSRGLYRKLLAEAHVEAFWTYRPRLYTGRVAVFRASEQPAGLRVDPTLGWSGLVAGELECHEVAAYHDNILKEPPVRTLAEDLAACLDRAAAPATLGLVSVPAGFGPFDASGAGVSAAKEGSHALVT